MVKFSQLIDFDSFNVDNYESISDNEDRYIAGKDNDEIPYYIDHEIEHNKMDRKFVNKKTSTHIKFIESILETDLDEASILKDRFVSKNSEFYERDHFVAYKLGDYYVMFMRVVYVDDSNEISIAGIIRNNLDKPKYVFVGSEGEKYFIHSHLFSYADSNGIAEGSGFVIDPKNWNGYTSMSNEDYNQDPNVFLTSGASCELILGALVNTLKYIKSSLINGK